MFTSRSMKFTQKANHERLKEVSKSPKTSSCAMSTAADMKLQGCKVGKELTNFNFHAIGKHCSRRRNNPVARDVTAKKH